MRRAGRTPPTRLNLLRTRRRLARVREGADLLRRKREALVRELLEHARPAVGAREEIGRAALEAYPRLVDGLAAEGGDGVRLSAEPLPAPEVEMTTTRLWGVTVGGVRTAPTLERTLEARGTAPGPTDPSTVEAADRFERLARLLLEAAPREMLLRRLGSAVAQTSRQVRALEMRVEPELVSDVTRITTLLDEREREDHLRLRRFLGRRRRAASPDTGEPR